MVRSTTGCNRNAYPEGYHQRFLEDLAFRENMLRLCHGPNREEFIISPVIAQKLLKAIGVIVTLSELCEKAEAASVSDELAVANAYVQWYLMICCLLAGMLLGYLSSSFGPQSP
jgi:preprotein translocase subunit Sss1